MATYAEIYALRYGNADFRNRVTAAMVVAAKDVLLEDPGMANHANRVIWAQKVAADALVEAERIMWGVCMNATIQANGIASTDPQILTAVNAVINVFAQ